MVVTKVGRGAPLQDKVLSYLDPLLSQPLSEPPQSSCICGTFNEDTANVRHSTMTEVKEVSRDECTCELVIDCNTIALLLPAGYDYKRDGDGSQFLDKPRVVAELESDDSFYAMLEERLDTGSLRFGLPTGAGHHRRVAESRSLAHDDSRELRVEEVREMPQNQANSARLPLHETAS
jgi:hypothetical protein